MNVSIGQQIPHFSSRPSNPNIDHSLLIQGGSDYNRFKYATRGERFYASQSPTKKGGNLADDFVKLSKGGAMDMELDMKKGGGHKSCPKGKKDCDCDMKEKKGGAMDMKLGADGKTNTPKELEEKEGGRMIKKKKNVMKKGSYMEFVKDYRLKNKVSLKDAMKQIKSKGLWKKK